MEQCIKVSCIEDIIACNKRNGLHFFDKDTMRFFRSKVYDEFVQRGNYVFFCTSEKNVYEPWEVNEPRKFIIKVMDMRNGSIETYRAKEICTELQIPHLSDTIGTEYLSRKGQLYNLGKISQAFADIDALEKEMMGK